MKDYMLLGKGLGIWFGERIEWVYCGHRTLEGSMSYKDVGINPYKYKNNHIHKPDETLYKDFVSAGGGEKLETIVREMLARLSA